eukprot:COSAG02_NODE_919_length_15936_cov_5.055314_5_plen_189_part_00
MRVCSPETDRATVEKISVAIKAGEALTVQLLNYKKDGSKFWNQLQLMPVKDGSGRVTQYVGAQNGIRAADVNAAGAPLHVNGTADDGVDSSGASSPAEAAGSTPAVATGSPASSTVGEAQTDLDAMTSIASLLACEFEENVRRSPSSRSIALRPVPSVCLAAVSASALGGLYSRVNASTTVLLCCFSQ